LGGNSLLDIFVFGRRSGKAAAIRAKDTKIKRLTLEHVKKYQAMLKNEGIEKKTKSPLLLPDYRYDKALTKTYK
jgi:succinate dehydrogenase / fumarate reductase flavoprotein subunit